MPRVSERHVLLVPLKTHSLFRVSNLFFSLLSPFSRYTFLTMSDRIKEFAELPQQFVKEGTQVRSLHLSQFGEAQ